MVILVLVNYVLVLTFLLALLVLRERRTAPAHETLPAHSHQQEGRHSFGLMQLARRCLAGSMAGGTASAQGWRKLSNDEDQGLELVQAQAEWGAGMPACVEDSAMGAVSPARNAASSSSPATASAPAADNGTASALHAIGGSAPTQQHRQPAHFRAHVDTQSRSGFQEDADPEAVGLLSAGSESAWLSVTSGPQRPPRVRGRRWRGCCACVDASTGARVDVHTWLGGPYADALYLARWVILAFAALAVAFFGWRASLLTLPESRPTVWRASSNMHKYYDIEMQFAFGRALERIPLTLTWGLRPVDTGSLNSVYEYTDAVLDTHVNMTAVSSQVWLAELCDNLTAWSEQPGSPIVADSVRCPTPLLRRIAQARKLPWPMPPEVRASFAAWQGDWQLGHGTRCKDDGVAVR